MGDEVGICLEAENLVCVGGGWRWRVRSLEGLSELSFTSWKNRSRPPRPRKKKKGLAPEQCTKDKLADSSLGPGSSSANLACLNGTLGFPCCLA